MKLFLCLVFCAFSISPSFARCKIEAENIAEDAVRLFDVNDGAIHCMAMGGLKSLVALPVIKSMPMRYAYAAEFFFPCGPHPRNPKVTVLFNSQCRMVDLKMTGHEL